MIFPSEFSLSGHGMAHSYMHSIGFLQAALFLKEGGFHFVLPSLISYESGNQCSF